MARPSTKRKTSINRDRKRAKAHKFPAVPTAVAANTAEVGRLGPLLGKAAELITYVVNNVPANELNTLVKKGKQNPRYVSHSIHDEPDGEFTVVFVYRK